MSFVVVPTTQGLISVRALNRCATRESPREVDEEHGGEKAVHDVVAEAGEGPMPEERHEEQMPVPRSEPAVQVAEPGNCRELGRILDRAEVVEAEVVVQRCSERPVSQPQDTHHDHCHHRQ